MSFEKQQQSYIAHVSPKTMKMGRSASLETRTTAGLETGATIASNQGRQV